MSAIFLICGIAIFVFGSNYFNLFPTNNSFIYKVTLTVVFLVASIIFSRIDTLKKYWQIAYAYFIASFVTLITWFSLDWVLNIFGVSSNTEQGLMVEKLAEALLVVLSIVLLTKLAKMDLGSIYLQKGNLKLGLFVGSSMLVNNICIAFIVGSVINNPEILIGWFPWALIFSLANGFMEELWLRGLFLRKYEFFIGGGASILVTSIVFTMMHFGAVYLTPEQVPFFLGTLFPLALLWGYLMRVTKSLWGSTLFHAGSDIFYFLTMGF
jgi:membrane protease YdiL (CAAX protease family)